MCHKTSTYASDGGLAMRRLDLQSVTMAGQTQRGPLSETRSGKEILLQALPTNLHGRGPANLLWRKGAGENGGSSGGIGWPGNGLKFLASRCQEFSSLRKLLYRSLCFTPQQRSTGSCQALQEPVARPARVRNHEGFFPCQEAPRSGLRLQMRVQSYS